MFVDIPDLKLAFIDFALVSVILAIMYSITVFETLVSASNHGATGVALAETKRAATWAFTGILVTLTAGVFAAAVGGRRGSAALVVPFFFMARWAYFHWTMSKLLDVKVVLEHFDQTYRTSILEALREGKGGLTVDQIHERATNTSTYSQMLALGAPLIKSVLPVPVGDIQTVLLPTRKKTEDVLRQLDLEKFVRQDGDLYFSAK